jgi:hypothetical protein
MLAAEGSEPYAWPLDLPRQITSSFGEYRAGRYHMAIDLRTGDIGKAVYAAEAGYVSRVRCSPYGYGKAIYLQLDDGHTVVYAHLDGFAEPLAEYVRQTQHDREKYTVDLYPVKDQFRVQRGQIIARSGQTGVGVPHLHFEIRDSAGRTINPREIGMTWPDKRRPVIRKVLMAPGGPDDRLNGDILPVQVPIRNPSAGQYVADPIGVYGAISVGAEVIDPANGGASRLGIRTLATRLGDRDVFRLQHDRLAYGTNSGGRVAYHPFYLNKGRFLLAWRWPGNRSESYAKSQGDGWFDAPLEEATLTVNAIDFFDNQATLTIPLKPQPPDLDGLFDEGANGGVGTVDLTCVGSYLVVTAQFSEGESVLPELRIAGDTPAQGGQFFRVDGRTFRAGYQPSKKARGVTLEVRHPRIDPYTTAVEVFHRGGASRSVEVGGVGVRVAAKGPYGTIFARVNSGDQLPGKVKAQPLLNTYTIWPEETPIDEPVELSFPAPEIIYDLERVHMYRLAGTRWRAETTERRDGRLIVQASRFGTYVAMEDVAAPAVTNVRPRSGDAITSRRPRLSANVRDEASGLASVTMHCDGEWILAEYDPEAGSVRWMQDEDLPSGDHDLTITATDNAGNVRTITRAVSIP